MPKENRILPDMLLNLVKKGYVCYVIAFCYILVALMAGFCKDCHSTSHQRLKRDSSSSNNSCDLRICADCSPVNGCVVCKRGFFLYNYSHQKSQFSTCVDECPKNHYKHRSKGKNTCKGCKDKNCDRCSIETYCSSCAEGFFELEGKCLSQCPVGFTPINDTHQCIECNHGNCMKCSSENHCSKCSVGYYKHKGNCLQECPSGYTEFIRKRQCRRRARCRLSQWSSWTACHCDGGRWLKKRKRIIKQIPFRAPACEALKETTKCRRRELLRRNRRPRCPGPRRKTSLKKNKNNSRERNSSSLWGNRKKNNNRRSPNNRARSERKKRSFFSFVSS